MNRHEKTKTSLPNNDLTSMRIALEEAQKAFSQGEFPVGCVIADAEGEVLARGHRKNSVQGVCNEIDHAEILTLRQLITSQPGIDLSQAILYSTMEPCLMCYSTILLSGIRRIVWAYEDVMGGGTTVPLSDLAPLYAEMEVEVQGSVLRQESLVLFQQFFRHHSYWQDSLLATYTLQQPVSSLEE